MNKCVHAYGVILMFFVHQYFTYPNSENIVNYVQMLKWFMVQHPHGFKAPWECSPQQTVIWWSKIDKVNETYHRSAETCLWFYKTNHLCYRGAFTCPSFPPISMYKNYYFTIQQGTFLWYHVGGHLLQSLILWFSTPYLMWKLPYIRGDLLHKTTSTLQLTYSESCKLYQFSANTHRYKCGLVSSGHLFIEWTIASVIPISWIPTSLGWNRSSGMLNRSLLRRISWNKQECL